MRNTDHLEIRVVFPTGPHGDLSSDDARDLEGLLAGARRHEFDFKRDGSRPQLTSRRGSRSRGHAPARRTRLIDTHRSPPDRPDLRR